ncbi:YggN family protein [Vibrio aestuarianus]|uniref:YggN family protein n=1 Tax=Vibrio aestuarianus TaxID=28171 RepID=A0A9X4FDS9_9VIBR|nr:YggN family protein [Vibrio aestuarianus]MDE1310376.1 YggN family protein [Vibrio aestuarianus]MDE1331040.1 YggN family protein [Vibrio aestuarianus]MDE1356472.1 YggN family protein [Vibrio aestuarianus]NGZ18716.1 YggN family protein [Vibrio aestuarianus]NGZ94237.1 YggN family protein [Vibrio aestuarianus subsp. cardii]
MKKIILLASMLLSSPLWAAQCRVNVGHEVHLDGEKVEIIKTSTDKVLMDDQNNLYIHGERVELDAEQQSALEKYQEDINTALPKAKQLASDGLALANDILDDVAASIDSPNAFDKVKQSMTEFFADIESRYYQGDDLVLPAQTFESMSETWAEDFENAKALFNQEFIASAFEALSSKMQQEGGLNLTELANTMAELKDKLAVRINEYSNQIQKENDDFCESLDNMVEQEQQLHQKIPELKDYQVFTI